MLKDELRKARIAAGFTQEKLAAKANVSREHVNYIERGKTQPTVAMFIRLCQAMGIYAPDLLKRIMPISDGERKNNQRPTGQRPRNKSK